MSRSSRERFPLNGVPSLVAMLLLMLAGPLQSQEAAVQTDLPSASAVIERFVEAIGGEQAIRNQGARQGRGNLTIAAQGISGTVEAFVAPPNKSLMKIELAGLGTVRTGYDGKTGWIIHPAMGPMVLDGRMLEQMQQQADMLAALHPEKYIASAETLEKSEFEGRLCYKVKITTHSGEEYFEFFDADSGLLAGTVRKQASPMGEIETISILSDYRPVKGVLIPMRLTQRLLGMEQVFEMTEFVAAELDDSVFEPPPEIQALLEGAS